jgi:hypothetical protein
MQEHHAPSEFIKSRDKEVETVTTYYTSKGNEDFLNEGGYPVQREENKNTLAKESGRRKMIRIDDRGHIIDPKGLYANKRKMDRWIPVNDGAFSSYIEFLRTGNQIFIRHTERNLGG